VLEAAVAPAEIGFIKDPNRRFQHISRAKALSPLLLGERGHHRQDLVELSARPTLLYSSIQRRQRQSRLEEAAGVARAVGIQIWGVVGLDKIANPSSTRQRHRQERAGSPTAHQRTIHRRRLQRL
jgi:hypothetical protein